MKDCDVDSLLPSMQKDSSLFNEFVELKLPESEEKLKEIFEYGGSVHTKQEVIPVLCGENVGVKSLERKVKVLIKEGVIEGNIKQEMEDEKKSILDYSEGNESPYLQENNQKVKESREDKKKVRKRAYTPEEDRLILEYVKAYGDKNWSKIAELIPGRNRKQLRDHYINFLKKKLNKNGFTEKEDKVIRAMVANHGNSWKRIADNLPGRTPLMIKNRYNTILRKQAIDTTSIDQVDKEDVKELSGSEKNDDSLDSVRSIVKELTREIKKLQIIPK